LWSKKQMKDKKHNNGFNTPKNYFEDFEDRLFYKMSEDIIPKESGFSTPKGYFDQLDSSILQKTNTTVPPPKVIPLFSKKTIAYTITIAACAILIFSIRNPNQTLTTIETIDFSSIKTYLEEGNIELTNDDLISLLTEEDLNSLLIDEILIPEETIEEYLIENINDTSILIE